MAKHVQFGTFQFSIGCNRPTPLIFFSTKKKYFKPRVPNLAIMLTIEHLSQCPQKQLPVYSSYYYIYILTIFKKTASEERIRNGCKKIMKSRQGSTQGRLDTFFSVTGSLSSKRKVGGFSVISLISGAKVLTFL